MNDEPSSINAEDGTTLAPRCAQRSAGVNDEPHPPLRGVQGSFIVHRSPFIVQYSECGQTSVFVAMLVPVLLLLAGVIADGGRLLVEYRRAQVAIDAAAFAAAQRVDTNTFLATQAILLDPAQATAVGGLYGSLNSRGSVHVTSIEVSGGTVAAHGYAEVDTFFLSMFGAERARLSLTSRAVPLYGIWREKQ